MLQEIDNLVMLLEAESPEVRDAVRSELMKRSRELESWYQEHHQDFSPEIQFDLYELMQSFRQDNVRDHWLEWLEFDNHGDRLEAALTQLARLDPKTHGKPTVSELLDDLAETASRASPVMEPFMLNRFLFVEGRFSGSRKDYLNPDHGNMVHVLQQGRGLPISLAMVFILCGRRLDLSIDGFNQPGHFLARANVEDRPYLFDCFDNGRILTNQDIYISTLSSGYDLYHLLNHPPTAVDMVSRVLCNMVNSYYRNGSLENSRLCGRLLRDLRNAGPQRLHLPVSEDNANPAFSRGDLVRHKRYGYRGVVVDYDTSCQAEDEWYYANQTQPNRNQPWYYVLVADSDHNTYVAESNLTTDYSGEEITHPMLKTYFRRFSDGRYERNNIPWQLPL